MKTVKNFIGRMGIFGDLLKFLWKERMWWIIPIVITLVLLGLLMIFAQSSAVAPFIYTLF